MDDIPDEGDPLDPFVYNQSISNGKHLVRLLVISFIGFISIGLLSIPISRIIRAHKSNVVFVDEMQWSEYPSNNNYAVKVFAPSDKGVLVAFRQGLFHRMAFLVEAGDSQVIYLPQGAYTVYFATGENWHGSNFFGRYTKYYRLNKTVQLHTEMPDSVSGWTFYFSITSKEIREIPASEFPIVPKNLED